MGGWVKHDQGGFHYDPDHVSTEQFLDELTDEMIDYMLALQEIMNHNLKQEGATLFLTPQGAVAYNVLAKYGKEES